ncbi:barstar family protein [Kitasatospora sp. NPDC001540]|uniref:barstar family protein n=1 Tax=Kitasatospora sp. NPDC001540 TaxID=3364014 RepID=UPI00369C13ED
MSDQVWVDYVRAENHARWDRPFPVRYLLVAEDWDEEGQDWHLLGRCAAVEGLFADPPPPPREVLAMRGCAPGARPGPLGPTSIVGRAAEPQDDAWWTLLDAEVLAVTPHADDPALVDVTLGAGVQLSYGSACGPGRTFLRFELTPRHDVVTAACATLPGLAVERPEPAQAHLRLIGCEPAEPMRRILRKRKGAPPTYTELWALDAHGRRAAVVSTGFDVEWTRPSVLGGALVDVLLSVDADLLPGSAARAAWRHWLPGRPRKAGSWRGLTAEQKQAWLLAALRVFHGFGPDRSGGEYHLDGAGVQDEAGLHCAIGEAIRGPGGYYGGGLAPLLDCLCGGFGVVPPFTLVWHDFATTERELAEASEGPVIAPGYPEELARALEQHGVTVVRA